MKQNSQNDKETKYSKEWRENWIKNLQKELKETEGMSDSDLEAYYGVINNEWD